MCGIVGYIGKRKAVPILIAGLKRLEYRGYDSAGVAVIEDGSLQVAKEAGKISKLEETVNQLKYTSTIGIGHTRWATHGEPTRQNAHPHLDGQKNIAIIHNGIIENYSVLKNMLEKKGHQFLSNTDTEVVAHLIDEFYQGDFEEALHFALGELAGTYGFAVISKYEPDKIYVARQGSPLIVGVGKGENFIGGCF